MQNGKRLFRLLTYLFAVAFFNSHLQAQMTIGNDVAPHAFSLLEIDNAYLNGGMRLPQLTAAQCDSLKNEFLKPSASQDYKDAAEGLVVYNVDAGCVEFWIGEDWESSCENSASGDYSAYLLSACDAPDQPGAIDGPQIVAPKVTSSVTYSVANVSGVTYTWTLPVGWTGSSTGSSITVTLSDLSQSGTISVTANKSACSSAPSALKVIVGCGAKISATEWKEFMCWNLGADQSANPFEPTAALNGDYYQWGSKTPMATVDGLISGWSATPGAYYGDNTTNPTTIKSETDPCPDGFRIPNSDEWNGVMSLNPRNDRGAWTDSNDCMDCWTGAMLGDALFLPAAGLQYNIYSMFGDRGHLGFYQSSTLFDSTRSAAGVIQAWSDVEASDPLDGISVRCIKQ